MAMETYTHKEQNGTPYSVVGTFKFGGMTIEEVEREPCYKLSQYGKGERITCQCSVCASKGESHEVIKARMDKIYKV